MVVDETDITHKLIMKCLPVEIAGQISYMGRSIGIKIEHINVKCKVDFSGLDSKDKSQLEM